VAFDFTRMIRPLLDELAGLANAAAAWVFRIEIASIRAHMFHS
jgi:hypothetical protein